MANLANLLGILAIVAGVNEILIERFLGAWHSPTVDKLLVYVALILGIAEAIAFNINGLEMLGFSVAPIVGQFATGLVLGGGAEVIHKIRGLLGVGETGK